MEEYIKLKDLEELLASLYQEPEYQHTGETYYAGISAVQIDIDSLPTITIPESAQWLPYSHTMMECSACGRLEDRTEPYCHCGAKMEGAL